ncbi:hypothetical protein HRbin36_01553 [bacterium HR36]|nr:hypothetical protein HRbin36_01553 [bacterium HR36]
MKLHLLVSQPDTVNCKSPALGIECFLVGCAKEFKSLGEQGQFMSFGFVAWVNVKDQVGSGPLMAVSKGDALAHMHKAAGYIEEHIEVILG